MQENPFFKNIISLMNAKQNFDQGIENVVVEIDNVEVKDIESKNEVQIKPNNA